MTAGDENDLIRSLVPDYAAPADARPRPVLPYLAIATWCGALPLAVGTAIFLLWLATGYGGLQAIGAFTLLGGLVLFFVGSVSLLVDSIHPRAERSAGGSTAGRNWKRAGVAGLLLVNFPAAVAIVYAVDAIESRITVFVQNAGTVTIDSFVVTAPGFRTELGPIPPGASRRARFDASADGAVEYSMAQGSDRSAGTVMGYVTRGIGGARTVVVNGPVVTVK